jgi:DNA (cytosine-5)-methyltransferase 1
MRVIDFFCGAGGFSEGFRQAGFEIVLAVDNWKAAVTTHKANHPKTNVILDDVERISNLPDDEFHKLVPDSEVIIGSPPCVAFSNSNRSGKANKKNGIALVKAYLRIVARKKFKKDTALKYWLLENVPNIEKYLQEEYTAKELNLKGSWKIRVKNTNSRVYNVKYYGVPSNRKRYICGEFPEPIQTRIDLNLIQLGTVLNALGTPCKNLEKEIQDPCYALKIVSKEVTDHHYVQHLADFEWRKAKIAKQDKGYMGRMAFPEDVKRPARTIMATMSFSVRESMVFSDGNGGYRAPTIREVSSLMSFPIDYRFYGRSIGQKYKLVGNAVPPKMSFAFAKAILENEKLRSPCKYLPLNHENLDFYNLNSQIFHIKTEKPKKPDARFKYHIPYTIMDAYRVELTNYKSNFEKNQIKWDVEIHKSQGPKAKVYTPLVDINCISKNDVKIIDDFIKKLTPLIVSFHNFQNLYCLTETERANNLGPFELLIRLKRFLGQTGLKCFEEAYIDCEGAPFKLPAKIAIGYFILDEIVKKMEVLSCKKT